MNIIVTPNESPTIDVVIPSKPIVGVTIAPPIGLEVIGMSGPPGPPGESGTIVHVGSTPPSSPQLDDLWVDTT